MLFMVYKQIFFLSIFSTIFPLLYILFECYHYSFSFVSLVLVPLNCFHIGFAILSLLLFYIYFAKDDDYLNKQILILIHVYTNVFWRTSLTSPFKYISSLKCFVQNYKLKINTCDAITLLKKILLFCFPIFFSLLSLCSLFFLLFSLTVCATFSYVQVNILVTKTSHTKFCILL